MDKESVLLFETKNRKLGFLVYDECRNTGGAYLDIEMKVLGDSIRVYAVPFYALGELQPLPRLSFQESMAKLKGLVKGVEAGFLARN
jgi:hypothetical protein